MQRALVMERVRSDIEVLARAGLEVQVFLDEVDLSLSRAVPHDGLCASLQDPVTALPTATFKLGGLRGRETHDLHWCEIEFGEDDPTSFRRLTCEGTVAVGVHQMTGGEPLRSVRMREFMDHHFGFTDELRAVARTDGEAWGALSLLRCDPTRPFTDEEVAFVASLSEAIALGIRTGLLARCAAVAPSTAVGPGVLVVRDGYDVAERNEAADHWLSELAACDNSGGPVHTIAALVAGARRYAAGTAAAPPRARVRAPSGAWLLLHATPLAGADGSEQSVVVTIEVARAPEVLPLVVAAFGLSARERDVTELVLHGASSKQIARRLGISVHTVQDHLKSVFEKADVRSRRELVARVFFDQHLPRLGQDLAPSGWFLPDDRRSSTGSVERQLSAPERAER